MEDHDKTFKIIWLKEGFREFNLVRFLPHSFSGSFDPFLRAVSFIRQEKFPGGRFSGRQFPRIAFRI